jgi:hypothetical protein
MKFILQIAATVAICLLLQTFFPWWTLAIGSFAVAFMVGNKGGVSFAAGFIGAAVLWLGMAYYIDQTTHSILTEKVNRLLPLNSFLLTTLIGGLVGGFAALTGALLTQSSRKK